MGLLQGEHQGARTLERWRWLKTGSSYTKFGGKVVYAALDIEA